MPCVNGSRIVVITQGPRETILAGQRLGIVKYKVLPIDQKLVVDTTGAGDAFCGGFISSLLESSKLKNRNDSHLLAKSLTQAGIHAPLGPGWSRISDSEIRNILMHSGFDIFALRGCQVWSRSFLDDQLRLTPVPYSLDGPVISRTRIMCLFLSWVGSRRL